jgi:hypothetical protein
MRRRDAGLSARGRVRCLLGDQRDVVQRRDAGLLHAGRDVRAVRFERAVQRRGARLQHGHARLPRLRERRRMWGLDAGLPDVGGLRAVLGDERERVRRRDAGLLHAVGDLRALRVERAVHGQRADLQHDDARLPRLRGRR